jgi:hypothetical protein
MSENKTDVPVFIVCLDSVRQINEIVKSGKLTERQMEIIVLAINRVLNFNNVDNTDNTDNTSNNEPPISKLELD